MANELVTEVILNLDKARASLAEYEKQAKQTGETAGKAVGENVEKGVSDAFSGIKTKLLALGGAIAGAFALRKMIAAANEGDAAVQRLNSAMFANGTFTNAASERFVEFAESMQKMTVFSNDAITSNAALLVSMNGLTGQGLERASKAAIDLSAGLGIGLDSAFNIVSRAAEGNTMALRRMGLAIAETGTIGGNFAATLAAIEQRFKGMAEAQTKTFGGAMAQATNNFDDLLKTLGQFVTRSPVVISIITEISKFIDKLTTSLQKAGGESDPMKPLIQGAIRFGVVFNDFVIKPVEFLWNVFKTRVLAVGTAFTGLIAVFYTINAAFAEYIAKPVIDFVANGLGKVVGFFNEEAGKNFAALGEQFTTFALNTSGQISAVTGQMSADLATATATAANDAFQFQTSEMIAGTLSQWDGFIASVSDKLNTLPEQVGPPLNRLNQRLIAAMNAIRASVSTGLGTVIEGTVTRLGAALVKGGSAFDDFKSMALNAIGDMSINMGKAMILQSAAFTALAALIANPFTAAAGSLAFGLALVALGGVLKAAAGEGAAAGAGVGGGVSAGGGGVGGGASEATALAAAPIDEQRTNVQVVVQGNIMDRRQTGLELAEVINEAFGSGGVVYATGG